MTAETAFSKKSGPLITVEAKAIVEATDTKHVMITLQALKSKSRLHICMNQREAKMLAADLYIASDSGPATPLTPTTKPL